MTEGAAKIAGNPGREPLLRLPCLRRSRRGAALPVTNGKSLAFKVPLFIPFAVSMEIERRTRLYDPASTRIAKRAKMVPPAII
jgi:hypothetical protein